MADFVADVAANVNQIKETARGGLFLIRRSEAATGETLVVEPNRREGGFYEVITAGKFRRSVTN